MDHYGLESDQLRLRIYNPSSDEVEDKEYSETWQMTNSFIWEPYGEKKFILIFYFF